MQYNENEEIILQKHYYYGGYINYKAFRDFHLNNGLDDKYFRSNHCLLLGFIVEKFHKHLKTPNIMHDGKKYIQLNNKFILDNLINLKVKHRTITYYIAALKKSKLISVEVRGENNRYVHVNSELIKLCYDYDSQLRPINFLQNNKPELWKAFVFEWKDHFDSKESFKNFIDNFNDNRDVKAAAYNTGDIYTHLLNSVRYHLYGKGHEKLIIIK